MRDAGVELDIREFSWIDTSSSCANEESRCASTGQGAATTYAKPPEAICFGVPVANQSTKLTELGYFSVLAKSGLASPTRPPTFATPRLRRQVGQLHLGRLRRTVVGGCRAPDSTREAMRFAWRMVPQGQRRPRHPPGDGD